MDLQAQIIQAIRDELQRQQSNGLYFDELEGQATLSGSLDLEALAMAVSGAVAGGP